MTTSANDKMEKTPSESETITTQVVYPNDTNPMGMLQGGKLVQWMDTASAVCAQIHAGKIAVTVSLNNVVFLNPAKIGDVITIKAKMTRAFGTSMEVFAQVWARSITSTEKTLINEAYFTFVALDADSKPAPVCQIKPVTKAEKMQYVLAATRRENKQAKTISRKLFDESAG
jgi:acyl-CoA hydrolase